METHHRTAQGAPHRKVADCDRQSVICGTQSHLTHKFTAAALARLDVSEPQHGLRSVCSDWLGDSDHEEHG